MPGAKKPFVFAAGHGRLQWHRKVYRYRVLQTRRLHNAGCEKRGRSARSVVTTSLGFTSVLKRLCKRPGVGTCAGNLRCEVCYPDLVTAHIQGNFLAEVRSAPQVCVECSVDEATPWALLTLRCERPSGSEAARLAWEAPGARHPPACRRSQVELAPAS